MTEFIYYPDEKLIIILLNNFGTYEQNVWSLGMGIASIVLELPYDNWSLKSEVKIDKSILRKHVGIYKNGKTKIEIKYRDDKLYAAIPGLPDMRLLAEAADSYYLENFNSTLKFNENILTIHEHGEDSQWVRKN